MFEKLKQYVFDYRLKHTPKESAQWLEWDNVRNILVLYESDYIERNEVIKAIRDKLLLEEKDVTIWGYVAKKELTSLILPQSRILGLKDFNWLDAPKEEIVGDLQKRTYDLLLDLTQHPCLPLRYLGLYAHAYMKVGMHIGEGVHDFMVSMPAEETPEHLFAEIKHFLMTIKQG